MDRASKLLLEVGGFSLKEQRYSKLGQNLEYRNTFLYIPTGFL